jgi:hypothetical protein
LRDQQGARLSGLQLRDGRGRKEAARVDVAGDHIG